MNVRNSLDARRKLVILLVLVNLFAIAWTTWNIVSSRNEYLHRAETSSKNLAAALDLNIAANVEKIDLVLLSSVDFFEEQLAELDGLDAVGINTYLRKIQQRVPNLSGLRATDAEGTVLYGNGVKAAERASWAERDFFAVLRANPQTGLVITNPVFGKVTKMWLISFVRRYNHPDGRFAGVISASVNIDYLDSLISALDVGPHGVALMRDSNLGMIARYPKISTASGQVGAKGFSPELQAAIESGKQVVSFHATNTSDGIERLNTYRRLNKPPFHLVAGLSVADVLATWYNEILASLAGLVVFMLATTLAIYSLIRTVERTEQLVKSKSQFLANMSHEIRTPMNAILGLLGLLQGTELTHRQRDYASKAHGAAHGLLGLLNDILDFSKVNSGKMTLESLPFRLDTQMRNLSVVLSSNIKSVGVEVLFDIDPQLPEVVMGDAMRLHQILVNIGGNAVKFTENGQVVVSLKLVHSSGDSVRIAFAVQDSGIGIAPEHQQQIFSGFSQAEASTTRRFGGSGLGLVISKSLIELMGGTLQLDSALGLGTTFSFQIEFPTVQDLADELLAPVTPRCASQRVLIVDDNPVAHKLLLKMVQSMGWQGECVSGGNEALAKIDRERNAHGGAFPYTLILMDWQMPQMDGGETSRQVRNVARQCAGEALVIIMLSDNGRQNLALRTEQEQLLVNGFLVKPVSASMILDAVMDASAENSSIRRLSAGRASNRQLVGMRILVVEDNLINQQVADELLSAEGAIVSLAANGQLGVDAVHAAAPQFDVVLMDVQMPVMDGYTATGAIRNDLGLTQLPIIAMTANAMASDREACIAAGMNEHIGKPFDMAKLVSLLIRTTGFTPPAIEGLRAQTQTIEEAATRLASVEGLDLQGAIARMSGLRSLYTRTAKDFLKILSTVHGELSQLLRDQDRKKVAMTLHTLKGNAGTLGATALADEVKRLEQLCKSDLGCEQCQGELAGLAVCIEHAKLLLTQAISTLDSEVAAAPAAPQATQASSADLLSDLSELADLLKKSDMEALQKFAQMRVQLEALPDGLYDRLDAALQDFDFEAAHTICENAHRAASL
jgi:signal transduction histidine kinase/CheY-like chemotaxis protein